MNTSNHVLTCNETLISTADKQNSRQILNIQVDLTTEAWEFLNSDDIYLHRFSWLYMYSMSKRSILVIVCSFVFMAFTDFSVLTCGTLGNCKYYTTVVEQIESTHCIHVWWSPLLFFVWVDSKYNLWNM